MRAPAALKGVRKRCWADVCTCACVQRSPAPRSSSACASPTAPHRSWRTPLAASPTAQRPAPAGQQRWHPWRPPAQQAGQPADGVRGGIVTGFGLTTICCVDAIATVMSYCVTQRLLCCLDNNPLTNAGLQIRFWVMEALVHRR